MGHGLVTGPDGRRGAVVECLMADSAYEFAPSLPNPSAFGPAVPALLDLIGRDFLTDEVDAVAIHLMGILPGAVALWRVWRAETEIEAPPVRIFVVEIAQLFDEAVPAIEGALAATGETAQVEIYQTDDKLSAYARKARNSGALLWTAAEAPPVRIARVFDVVDAQGGRFDPGHEQLAEPERDEIATYLEAGAPVLATEGTMIDAVEPERGSVVPMSYRTDGRWLWTESVAYYLRAYGMAPEAELLAHVRACLPGRPAPDAAAEHRALAVLFQSMAIVRA